MAALHIRDLDASVLLALKRRAGHNHRSLSGEVRAILEQAIREPVTTDAPTTVRRRTLALHTVEVGGSTTWSRDDIYDG